MSIPQSNNNPKIPADAVPSATVVVGNVTPDNDGAKFSSDGGLDTDYQVNSEYDHPQNILMLPIASPFGFQGKTAVFVQVATPVMVWRVDWTACRVGGKPVVPINTPADRNWVFLRQRIETALMTQMADGSSPLFRISGTYWYGHKRVRGNMHKVMAFARPPWLDNSFDRSVPDAIFVQNIKDYLSAGGSSSPGSPGKG